MHQGQCGLQKTWSYSWCIVSELKLVSNMSLGQEVLDSNTSDVLVGCRFWEELIADKTAAAAWSTMAWTCSGGRLETGGVGVTVVWGFGVVIAGGLNGEVIYAIGAINVCLDCCNQVET